MGTNSGAGVQSGVRSVTAVLRAAGLIDTRHYNDLARDRGTALHAATHYLDEGDLDESKIDPAIAQDLEAYKRWRNDMPGFDFSGIEQEIHDDTLGFFGHPDRYGLRFYLDHRTRFEARRPFVLDIKRGYKDRWHSIQLAGYAIAIAGIVQAPSPYHIDRFNLYLHQGSYELVGHVDPLDYRVFRAALTVAEWRKKCQTS